MLESVMFAFAVVLLILDSGGQDGLKPLYSSSVVGTEFDFIRDTDPSTFKSVGYLGFADAEMPDKTDDKPLVQKAFQFEANYSDGAKVTFYVDEDFKTEKNAQLEIDKYLTRFGRLPSVLKKGVNRVVVHKGDATAFSDVGLIVLYSENADKRISTHDLEETLFHESVHSTWDKRYAQSEKWIAAQKSDGGFVTEYGSKNPDREDLAESALFALTLSRFPGRIPPADTKEIEKRIPARLKFFSELFPLSQPWIDHAGIED